MGGSRLSSVGPILLLAFFSLLSPALGQLPVPSNITFHLDATLLSNYGSAVTTWTDISGNGIVATAGNPSPTLTSATFRYCYPTVVFNGASMTTPSSANTKLEPGVLGWTWLAVAQQSATATSDTLIIINMPNNNANVGSSNAGWIDYSTRQGSSTEFFAGIKRTSPTTTTYYSQQQFPLTSQAAFNVLTGTLTGGATTVRNVTGYINGDNTGAVSYTSPTVSFKGTLSGSTNKMTIGSYIGNIMEIVMWNSTLTAAQVAAAQTYFAAKYYLNCPAIPSSVTYTTSGTCSSSATDGSTCIVTCGSQYTQVSGSSLLTCSVGSWSDAIPVCQYTCPVLTQPVNAGNCSKLLFSNSFANSSSLSQYSYYPTVPAAVLASYWNVTGGLLNTTAGSQCLINSTYPSIAFVSGPPWNGQTAGQWFQFNASVQVTSGMLGLTFRLLDGLDYYFVAINRVTGVYSAGLTQAGSQTVFCTNQMPSKTYNAGKFFALSVTMTSTGFVYYVNGALVCNISDTTFTAGTVGFYSQGSGSFANASLSTVCDGGTQCVGANDGYVCSYSCAAGYLQVSGSTSQTCNAGVWSGSSLVCSIYPPTFYNQTVSVFENATVGSYVGAPLVATQPGNSVSVTFVLLGGNTGNEFGINYCGGQIFMQLANLSYHAQNQYILSVAAQSNGLSTSQTIANITVNVLNVPHYPVFNSTSCALSVAENSPVGTLVGSRIAAYDVDGRNITYFISAVSQGAVYLTIGPSTGQLSTLQVYNYYTLPQFTAYVLAGNGYLNSSLLCTISVLHVNQPPVIQAASFQVNQATAYPLTLLGTIAVTDHDATDSFTFAEAWPMALSQYVTVDATTGNVFVANVGLPSQVVVFPTGTFNVPIVVNDTYGFSVLGNMTIQVIPAGSPIFQGFSSTPSAGFSTSGGDLVQIAAANLIGTSSLNATYQLSSPTLNISYATTNCTVLSSSSAQCYTVPGVGSGLSWTLSFGGSSIAIGQTVGPTAISYNPPVITGVTRASGSGGLSSLRTIGGDVIVVTGTNFGPDCNYTSAWFGSGWVLSLVSCNVTTLVLTTPSGAGAGYLLTVSIGGQTNTFNGATLSYAPPTVSALLGDTVLPTTGFNTQLGRMGAVTILGSNFGPNSTALTVTYSAGTTNFTASNCVRDVTQTVITCNSVAGVGAGLFWTVTVASQSSAPSVNSTSYPAPTLTLVTGVGAVDADTAGGQQVALIGLDFGPIVNPLPWPINATYGPTGVEYVAVSCSIIGFSNSSSSMGCTTAPGIGKNLTWRACVAGQCSAFTGSTSYGRPIVSYFGGSAYASAATQGDQVVTIYGKNFGPLGTPVTAVYDAGAVVSSVVAVSSSALTYPPLQPLSPSDYAVYLNNGQLVVFPALLCNVIVAHIALNCTTSPGAGTGLNWVITVGNQTSQSPVTAYTPPSITSTTLVGSSGPNQLIHTTGGAIFIINGTNFGPAYPRSYITSLTLGNTAVPNCTLTIPHAQVQCVAIPGVGTNLVWQITVLGQSAVSAQSVSYYPPLLNASVPASLSTDGGIIVLNGQDFGYDASQIALTVNGVNIPSITLTVPHTQITFPLAPIVGKVSVAVQVTVGGQPSNVLTLPVLPPLLEVVDIYDVAVLTPEVAANDSCYAEYEALLAVGVDTTIMEVTGADFGYAPEYVTVNMTSTVDSSVITCSICYLTSSEFRCATTASKTIVYNVSVSVVGQMSNMLQYNYRLILSPPNFLSVAPLTSPTEGGVYVTFTGTNFKDRGIVTLSNDVYTLTCATPPVGTTGNITGVYYAQDGTEIRCLVPPGIGANYEFAVTANNVYGVAKGYPFSYLPPAVVAITPDACNTTGCAVSINGSNFGAAPNLTAGVTFSETGQNVTVGGTLCDVSSWNHTFINCTLPPGITTDMEVVVQAGGQSSGAGPVFSYLPPVLRHVYPLNSSSNGGGLITFIGYNFGDEYLQLSFRVALTFEAALVCNVTWHSDTEGQCQIPEGAGADYLITADTLYQASAPWFFNGTNQTFSYLPPNITSVFGNSSVNAFPIVGNFLVFIIGESFSTSANVTISGNPCKIQSNTDNEIICLGPANVGSGHQLVVTAGGQSSTPYNFNYDPPVITSVTPNLIDGYDGQTITIYGHNFGLPADPTHYFLITVSGSTCAYPLFLFEFQLQCFVPGLQTIGELDVSVTTWNPYSFGVNATNHVQTSPAFVINATCPKGYFGFDGQPCQTCPVQAQCNGYGALPYARAGYYQVNSTQYITCIPAGACVGGNGSNQCAVGYTGDPCNTCEQGYYRLNLSCAKCPNLAWLLILAFVLAVLGLMFLGVWLNQRRINLAALGIGVDFAQMVAIFISLNFTWPKQLQSIFVSMSILNFNIQLLSPECTLKWSYTYKFITIAALPVIVLVCTMVAALLIKLKNYANQEFQKWRRKDLSPPTEVDSLYGLCFACFYYVYLQVVRNAMDPLDCIHSGNAAVMHAAPSITCSDSNPEFVKLRFISLLCLTVYGVGIPLLFLFVLWYYRKEIDVDQNLRKQALGNTTASNPFYFVRRRFQKLYSDFKPEFKYWRLLYLVRKLLLAFSTVLFTRWPIFQASISLSIMFGAYVLHAWAQPYMHRENIPSVFYEVVNHELLATKEVRLISAKQKELKNMAKLAKQKIVRYVFNYNLAEAISLIISTAIVICGMIFTSGALPTGDYRYWILVIFVGGTIASSLLIMFLIIIFETMRAFRYSKLYQEVSDYTESKMVRRVTTNAAGNKAMQMLFGRQHLAKAASENKEVGDGNGSSGSGDGVQMNPMARADRLKKLNSPVKPGPGSLPNAIAEDVEEEEVNPMFRRMHSKRPTPGESFAARTAVQSVKAGPLLAKLQRNTMDVTIGASGSTDFVGPIGVEPPRIGMKSVALNRSKIRASIAQQSDAGAAIAAAYGPTSGEGRPLLQTRRSLRKIRGPVGTGDAREEDESEPASVDAASVVPVIDSNSAALMGIKPPPREGRRSRITSTDSEGSHVQDATEGPTSPSDPTKASEKPADSDGLTAKQRLALKRATRTANTVGASPLLALSGPASPSSSPSSLSSLPPSTKAVAKLAASRLKPSGAGASSRVLLKAATGSSTKASGAGLWTEAETSGDMFSGSGASAAKAKFSQANPLARTRPKPGEQ